MSRNAVCLDYSLTIGTAKLIPVNLSFFAVCYQIERKDNDCADTGLCDCLVFLFGFYGLSFLLFDISHMNKLGDTPKPPNSRIISKSSFNCKRLVPLFTNLAATIILSIALKGEKTFVIRFHVFYNDTGRILIVITKQNQRRRHS